MSLGTKNAPIDLSLVSAPLNSTIKLYSSTSNAHSSAKVWRAFEGPFELVTSNGALSAEVKVEEKDDPQLALPGHPEARTPSIRIATSQNEREAMGSFCWGENEPRDMGSKASIWTSNGPLDFAIV